MMPRWMHRLFHNDAEDKRLEAELQFHLEQLTAANVEAGMTPEEARRQAQISLGRVEQVKQKTRDVHWENWIENVWRDLRFAVRSLSKDAGSSFLGAFALALGIGATVVVFSLFHGLLIGSLPYKDTARLVTFEIRNLTNNGGSAGRSWFTIPEFTAIKEQNSVFEDLVGYQGSGDMLTRQVKPRELFGGSHVTPNTFKFYGVAPLIGRAIAQEDGKVNAPPVFVMNYRLWQTEFGGDASILGQTFVVNGKPATLVGIMPHRFNIYGADIWMPTSSEGTFEVVGRLKPGISVQTVSTDLDVIVHRLVAAEPFSVMNPERYAVSVHRFRDEFLGDLKQILYMLFTAVLMLLLIACINVASLLLTRATVRERETALRAALGASRLRLVRQFLAESFVLSVAGCMGGWLLAYFGLKATLAIIPAGAIPVEMSVRLSLPVLMFALSLALLVALLCGFAPALLAARGDLHPRMANKGKGAGRNHSHGKLRASFVVGEVTLSIVLLVGAGLMMRNFFNLATAQLPFDPAKLLALKVELPRDRYYVKQDRKTTFFHELLPHVEALPGVVSATETWMVPPDDGMWTDVTIPGKPHLERWTTDFELCTEDYFRTLGLQLLHGRLLNRADLESSRYVAVVNETLARQYFGGEEPLGQRIKFDVFDRKFLDAPHNTYFEIVGVIKDFNTRPEYTDYRHAPMAFLPLSVVNLHYPPSLLVKTAGDPHALIKSVEQQVWSVDPEVRFGTVQTIEEQLGKDFQRPLFQMQALGVFAAIGLLLVIIGIFSVMAYTVSLQTHDIGIRMALGAQQGNILCMVLKKGLILIAVGIVIGVAASLGLTRFIASQLWGVSPTDPWTFAAVVVCIVVAGLAACWLPARRATQVDPVVTLRYE